MKTAELIPIILYQLIDGDKYGYEIIKQIEDKSNGGLVIKQPTLYSVLKKLEQGRFISSYWEDSEIGGKRHYYKLTNNGKEQLDTYPSFEILLKDVLGSEMPNITKQTASPSSPIPSEEIMPIEFTLPTQTINYEEDIDEDNIGESDYIDEVKEDIDEYNIENNENDVSQANPLLFETSPNGVEIKEYINYKPIDLTSTSSSNNFDLNAGIIEQSVEIEDNIENSQPLVEQEQTVIAKPSINIFDAIDYDNSDNALFSKSTIEPVNSDEQTTPKFTENVESIEEPYMVNRLYDKLTPNKDLIEHVKHVDSNVDGKSVLPFEEVKYLQYIDMSTNKEVQEHKKILNKHIKKMIATTITLLLVLISSIILCCKYSFSKIYCLSAVIVAMVIILYPAILISKLPKIRLKTCSQPFKYSIGIDFFIKLSIFLIIIITVFAYNLSIIESMTNILKFSNFANFWAPLMFGLIAILDFIYCVIVYRKYTKS